MFTRTLGRSVLSVLVLGAAVAANPAAAQTWTGGYVGGHVGTVNGTGTDGTYCEEESYSYSDSGIETEVTSLISEPSGSESSSYTEEHPAFWLQTRPGGVVYEGMDCYDTKGAATLDPVEGDWAGFAWYDTYLWDGLDELRGHLIGAQLGIRVQAGAGGVGPVWGLEVAHSILHVRDTVAGQWGFGYLGGGGAGLAQTQGEGGGCYCGFWNEWQGLFTLDTLTTATFTMGYGTPKVLVYAEAGLAIGRASFTTGNGFNGTGTGFGAVIGGGVEVRLTERLSMFAEFNHVRLNDIQMLGNTIAHGNAYPMLVDVNIAANILKIGFNIALGGN